MCATWITVPVTLRIAEIFLPPREQKHVQQSRFASTASRIETIFLPHTRSRFFFIFFLLQFYYHRVRDALYSRCMDLKRFVPNSPDSYAVWTKINFSDSALANQVTVIFRKKTMFAERFFFE